MTCPSFSRRRLLRGPATTTSALTADRVSPDGREIGHYACVSGHIDNALDGYGEVPEDDLAVLRQMVENGSDLRRPRLVEHFLYFPDGARARAAEAGITAAGWETRVEEPPPDGDAWLVLARDSDRVLTPSTVVEDGVFFAVAAQQLGGIYDGWEAEN